ncbi:MAG: hypothetical protein JOZ72_19060 [Alphaproteobacteria bacterium]|nr:hypothetical protein [Alphaproteobacteria bacterium]
MTVDRSVRSLSQLTTASSSRVLNLAQIGLAQADNPQHAASPLFQSPAMNSAIIVKHRLRADETYLFAEARAVATKIIIPFEKADLRVGGRSFFFGQRGFLDSFREVGNYASPFAMKHDLDVLTLLDAVPSLDPFLLREFLRNHDVAPDDCYFEISGADQTRMYTHAAQEVRRLTALAIKGTGPAQLASTAKIISALLSSEVGEKLEPLRATLRLGPEEFREGVFSWRGFLYYKWSLAELKPQVLKVLRDLNTIRVIGRADHDSLQFLGLSKRAIAVAVRKNLDEIAHVLGVYDNAYAALTEREDPKAFRDFLLDAPPLFLEMGEKMGAMNHIASFWKYRFPAGAPRHAEVEELSIILRDFLGSVGAHAAAAN